MDTDRHQQHRNNNSSTTAAATNTSELFICFTSRLSSSSSMKITSKSILSPGRARDSSQISLSTSLSRRLRNSGSMKGGQASPMFPATNGKKRGCSFENPEPSSPKVTCIGQVRVKTKKQGKKMRARSKSRREVSFRKPDQGGAINSTTNNSHNIDGAHYQDYGQMGHSFQQQECLPHRNQRWVHLPVTICEALRTFGAEFNCFLPCRSSCIAREKVEKASAGENDNASGSTSSCGAVFARWLVAEKIELVVGEEGHHRHEDEEEEEDEDDDMPRRSQRRHVFEDIVIEDETFEDKNEILENEEARVSVCVPPKNALLLMRCRSDPVKMAALANRFWECPPPQDAAEYENEESEDLGRATDSHQDYKDCQIKVEQEIEQTKEVLSCENLVCVKVIEEDQMNQSPDAEAVKEADLVFDREEEEQESHKICRVQEGDLQKLEQEEKQVLNQQPVILEGGEAAFENDSSPETMTDPEKKENENAGTLLEENKDVLENEPEPAQEHETKDDAFDDIEESRPRLSCSSVASVHRELEHEQEAEELTEYKETLEKSLLEEEEGEEETVKTRSEPEETDMTRKLKTGQESKEGESQKQQQQNLLPDCLLLMMCEPKLSMEVSKETWVCSTDFIRWERKPPTQIVNKINGCDEPKKRNSIDSNPAQQRHHHQHHHNHQLMQPPRSSCSFPAAPPLPPAHGAASMNSMIEQKLVGAKQSYEPFVLTRCKSEPMRSSTKLAPEACFWKNRKLEPHRPGTLGVGAAGVGF